MIYFYFIVNNNGRIVANFNTLAAAKKFAKENGWSIKNIRQFGH